jgi:hypothetical protein
MARETAGRAGGTKDGRRPAAERSEGGEKKKPGTESATARVRKAVAAKREKMRIARSAWTEREHEIRRWQWMVSVPPLAGVGTWMCGECVHLASEYAEVTGSAGVIAGTAIVGVTYVVRFGLRKRWVKRWSLRYHLAGAISGLWTALAVWNGPSVLLSSLLVIATLALSAGWYRAHRLPAPEPAATPAEAEAPYLPAIPTPVEVAEVVEDEVDNDAAEIIARWDSKIASKNRVLPGSVLLNPQRLATGWRFEVQLNDDVHEFPHLAGAKSRIAGAMGLPLNNILPEPDPQNWSRGFLTILTKNILAAGIPYQGPRYHEGQIAVGPYGDGTGWGCVQITNHKATCMNGLVCGDPGSGKSVFLENLGMSALYSGCWKVFYCDGSEDADSSSLLNDHMTWSMAGIDGAWKQLEALESYAKTRGLENNALPADVRGVNPSPERMGILWIIDEFHRLAKIDGAWAKRVEDLVRIGRKKGIAVWVATQGLELSGDFAGLATLRDILTSYNVVAFYSSSKYAHTLVSGVEIAPNTLPADGGYAYLATKRTGSRAAMLRTDFALDMTPWARLIPDHPWDEAGYLAVKKIMEANRITPEEARAEAARRYEAHLAKLRAGQSAVEDQVPAQQVGDSWLPPLLQGIKLAPALGADSLMSAADLADDVDEEIEVLELRPQHHAILAAVSEGVDRNRDIHARLKDQFATSTIDKALSALSRHGYLAKGGTRGEYVRCDVSAAA